MLIIIIIVICVSTNSSLHDYLGVSEVCIIIVK